MDLTIRHAGQPDSATADILFVDINNNVIFDNQAQLGLGGPRALKDGSARKKEAVIIDEADLLRPILASTTSIIPLQEPTGIEAADFLKLYQTVHNIVRNGGETQQERIIQKTIEQLTNQHPAVAWMNKTNQWEMLIRATFVAWKRLEKNRDYAISYEGQPDEKIFVRIMHYDNSGALDKHSHFAHFVHQAIVAHEQLTLKGKSIELPEPQITLSQGDIYHHLKGYKGPVNAISGTIGREDASKHLEFILKSDKTRELSTTLLPRAVTHRRYDFIPLSCPNREVHYQKLIQALFIAKDKGDSTLVVFKTLQEIQDFEKVLQAHQLGYQIYDDTFNPQDKRPTAALIINSAKEPGAITLTTGVGGRAANFEGIDLVLMTIFGDLQYDEQGRARGGRKGDFAITQTIFNQEEIAATSTEPPLLFSQKQKKMEDILTKQCNQTIKKQAPRYDLEQTLIQNLAGKTPAEQANIRSEFARAYL